MENWYLVWVALLRSQFAVDYCNNCRQSVKVMMKIEKTLYQASATYGTRAKRGTWNDFQWHAE